VLQVKQIVVDAERQHVEHSVAVTLVEQAVLVVHVMAVVLNHVKLYVELVMPVIVMQHAQVQLDIILGLE
jgi:hypothetical protein